MLSDFTGVIQKGTREESLLAAVAWDRLPRHVAIIMDGNGRWAAQRGQPRIAGHKAGVEAVRAAVDTGARLGLGALTLYAFSTENWKRPRYEVDALMRMLSGSSLKRSIGRTSDSRPSDVSAPLLKTSARKSSARPSKLPETRE
jgi:undecaprenyl pyrophosphate synthase